MPLTISLSAEAEELLQRRAADAGKDAETYAREAVEEKLREPKPFRQILAPLQEAFRDASLGDDELNALFTKLRQESWHERRRQDGKASR